jgi:hypothetical protein
MPIWLQKFLWSQFIEMSIRLNILVLSWLFFLNFNLQNKPFISISFKNHYDITKNGKVVHSKSGSFNIIYFKGYKLYEIPEVELEISKMDSNKLVPKKTTVNYFIITEGLDSGLKYTSLKDHQPKSFSRDSLLKALGIHKMYLTVYNYKVDKPSFVRRNRFSKKIEVEKYAIKKVIPTEPDSIYRYFNEKLRSLPFSFSRELDSLYKSKLCKATFVFTNNDNPNEKIRTTSEINEISSYNPKLFIDLLEKYKIDSTKK